jgi:hypothetical protein
MAALSLGRAGEWTGIFSAPLPRSSGAKQARIREGRKMNFGFSAKFSPKNEVHKQPCLCVVDGLFIGVLMACLCVVYECVYVAFTERKIKPLKKRF